MGARARRPHLPRVADLGVHDREEELRLGLLARVLDRFRRVGGGPRVLERDLELAHAMPEVREPKLARREDAAAYRTKGTELARFERDDRALEVRLRGLRLVDRTGVSAGGQRRLPRARNRLARSRSRSLRRTR